MTDEEQLKFIAERLAPYTSTAQHGDDDWVEERDRMMYSASGEDAGEFDDEATHEQFKVCSPTLHGTVRYGTVRYGYGSHGKETQ